MAVNAGWALLHRYHPVMVHLIPVRRCNLACAYCNEYDATSAPVPLPVLRRRVDLLARLGTAIVTLSGGEPLLHPELDLLVAHIRSRGMFATLITNGYLLSEERIEALNAAGLDHLQISIDNVEPDEVSMKSLRLLEPKLHWLAARALFAVNINSVVGGGIKDSRDALVVTRRARELGFSSSVGILHDGLGQLQPLPPAEIDVYRELQRLRPFNINRVDRLWQDNLAVGQPNQWRCRAGARYFYVDEFGMVHYCSQFRRSGGTPLEQYARADVRRAYHARKPCAPYCTINCAQQSALLDNWRSPQRDAVPPAHGNPALL
jgi:MoaA/NifB/PqqE/SkfB family radical SAM enzyme